ncbi:MAG: DUF58 domain-containing protein [Pirellulaceae bacterium]
MNYEIQTTETLDSRQFHIAVRALADSLSYGTDASPFLGSGTDYVQSRLYQPGDAVRAIDWRITARTAKYHVKEFETPKRMPCYLLVDTSASMTISSVKRSKYETAVFIAGGIALACLDRISPVAVLGVGERELRYSPSLSRDKILQWLHKLRRYDHQEITGITERIRELGPQLLTRSLIVVLSDLHQPESIQPLKRLGQKHDVVVIQTIDPAESNLTGAGFIRGREAETGRLLTTRGRNMGLNQDALEQEMKRGRVDLFPVKTNEPYAWRLRHFFKSRGLLGRGAR